MEIKTVTETLILRQQPVAGSPPVMLPGGFPVRVTADDVLVQVNSHSEEWSSVIVDRGGGTGPNGYLKTAYIVTRTLTPKPLTQAEFARLCAVAAATFEIDLAYLLALARIESGVKWDDQRGEIKAEVYDNQGATGPFQFMPSTWDDLVRQLGQSFFIRSVDIIDPTSQATLAAFLSNDGMMRHQAKFGGLPSPSELYLYHLFGAGAAQKVLAGNGTDRIDALLMAAHGNQNTVDAILAGNGSLLATSGVPRTRDGVLDEVAGRLHKAYVANAPLLANAPSWWPSSIPQTVDGATGNAPWLTVAQGQEGQTETPGPFHNPRISEYLSTVGFPSGTADETAWCAAFVTWCLLNSGDATAVSTAKKFKSSFAADWLKLPNKLLEPAIGALAITKSYSADTTGHVGFVAGIENHYVRLIAGNQRPAGQAGPECVCEKRFPRGDFVGFRWIQQS